MEIREGTEKDIPEILEVLKASLGETSSQKTSDVWRFKHVDNPFGKSLVLVAEEEGRVIGVRAFMRWKWQKGQESFSAFRAVDTATHPDHQGKGVFKKLTLKALEVGRENGDHFVFNTPNAQSKPGYLKMGWKEVDKLKINLRLGNPLFWTNSKKEFSYPKEWSQNYAMDFVMEYNHNLSKKETLFTPKNIQFLKWRYLDNPLQDYRVYATPDFFLAGYIKGQGKFRELRMSEIIRSERVNDGRVRKEIRKWARNYGVHFISYSPVSNVGFRTAVSGNFGPVLTFRNMNLSDQDQNKFLDIQEWNYSLGDLELF